MCYRGPTFLRRRAHRVLLNPVHVQDRCSCLSAVEQLKPAVFLLSTVLSCSALVCAAAEVSPCTVFMSHITYLIFALCWSVKLTAFSCRCWRFKCHKGKSKSLSPTRPFTWMDCNPSGFWAGGGWLWLRGALKGIQKDNPSFYSKVNV